MLLAPTILHAQSARGEIRDASGRPLEGVYVALLDEQREPRATTLSGEDGSFEIAAPAAGLYHLYLQHVGYATLYDGPYALNQTAPLEVTAIMHIAPIELKRLSVPIVGGVARLAAVGFYERRAAGFGWFLDREDLEPFEGRELADVFRRIPRVQVRDGRPEFGSPEGLLPPVVSFWSPSGSCRPMLYLDGVRADVGGAGLAALRIDDVLAPDLVEAVEVYTGPAQVPAQYSGSGGCGVILIWTRHAQAR